MDVGLWRKWLNTIRLVVKETPFLSHPTLSFAMEMIMLKSCEGMLVLQWTHLHSLLPRILMTSSCNRHCLRLQKYQQHKLDSLGLRPTRILVLRFGLERTNPTCKSSHRPPTTTASPTRSQWNMSGWFWTNGSNIISLTTAMATEGRNQSECMRCISKHFTLSFQVLSNHVHSYFKEKNYT